MQSPKTSCSYHKEDLESSWWHGWVAVYVSTHLGSRRSTCPCCSGVLSRDVFTRNIIGLFRLSISLNPVLNDALRRIATRSPPYPSLTAFLTGSAPSNTRTGMYPRPLRYEIPSRDSMSMIICRALSALRKARPSTITSISCSE